ncbi:MAG: hypothetical protein PVH33_10980 [Syntrophobacterales bacterium]|jgi:hypothetical protein
MRKGSGGNIRKHSQRRVAILGVLAVLILFASCTTTLRNKQLEVVAKDWALVIRASQVIPIYPLSEDLQPGDVLLVSMPIEEQVALYKEKGFLPLDQHMVRLYSKDFRNFYNSRYGITDETIPPAQWQKQNANGGHSWKKAPRAAFPTYQFSVQTGAGLNLAIPIQGVPFALGLMNSGSASGTVTIADAYTFGLDNFSMERLVREWGMENRRLLNNYEPRNGRHHYLRVVSRVYVTGRVSVTVNNDEATGAEVAAGADRPVKLMGLVEGSTDENYDKAIETINEFAAEQLPGAKVKIATASSRSVTLSEQFERPLVIGYIGFDLPILKGGRLGAAISTLSQLTERTTIPASSKDNVYRLAALSHMYQALKAIQGNEAEGIRTELDALDRLLPGRYPFSLYEFTSPREVRKDSTVVTGARIKREGFKTVLDFLGYAQTTIETLQGRLKNDQLKREYQAARSAREEMGNRLNGEPALMEAIDFVFLGS